MPEATLGYGRAPMPSEEPEPDEAELKLVSEPWLCEGCGHIGAGEEMRPLDNRCTCDQPLRRPLLSDGLTVIDPTTKVPNEYARRVRDRLKADQLYMQLHARYGHARAATATCDIFGHDARSGRCLRCGAGVQRDYED